jgi:hypothetical protein
MRAATAARSTSRASSAARTTSNPTQPAVQGARRVVAAA